MGAHPAPWSQRGRIRAAPAPADWAPHRLAWAAFSLPPEPFNISIGMWESGSIGDGLSIGTIR